MRTCFDDYAKAGGTAADMEHLPHTSLWPTMAPEAYLGLAGRIVETVDPHSEADPAATLAHLLVAVGNVVGPGPHARVQFDRHPAALFAAVVGPTAKGRKGTAWSAPRYLLEQVAPEWATTRIVPGLSSGEGLIYHVRDEQWGEEAIREKGHTVGYDRVKIDPGVSDKRLLVYESELSSVFKRMSAETNSLSAILRVAWDGAPLATLTKNSPLRATHTHVSLIGHITADELCLHLTEVDRANGFANRFLFLLVHRSKCLPEGGRVPFEQMEPLITDLGEVLQTAKTVGDLQRDAEASEAWAAIYEQLSAGEPGLVGAMLGRAEAQVLRLSLLYALLDRADMIRLPHLEAALAVWDFCEASVRRLFEGRLGLPAADMLLAALRSRGPLTRTQIFDLFGRNRSAADIDAVIDLLLRDKKIRTTTRETGGRAATVYELVP